MSTYLSYTVSMIADCKRIQATVAMTLAWFDEDIPLSAADGLDLIDIYAFIHALISNDSLEFCHTQYPDIKITYMWCFVIHLSHLAKSYEDKIKYRYALLWESEKKWVSW